MSAEEKAKKLVDDMYCEMHNLCITDEVLNEVAKQCALIAVDEILNSPKDGYVHFQDVIKYWQEVKSEIEKL